MDEEPIKVLLIEDNPGDARLIEEALAERGEGGFHLRWADDLAKGLDCLDGQAPDVVLLDLSLPCTRGLDTLASVLERSQDVPVIVMTGLDDESLAVEAVRRGAQDYLVKGQTGWALLRRAIHYAIQRKETQAQLADANARLEEANRRLAQLATTDELTGLWNRRYFLDVLSRECRRTARTGGDLALAMIDIDHFKAVNDTYGHAFGDRVLQSVAGHLGREARVTDIAARYGGEEFMVLMPDTDASRAATAGDRLRRRIAEAPLPEGLRAARVTVSVGVASLDGAVDPTGLLRHVDEALYAAKQAGRNCTRTWTEISRDQDQEVVTQTEEVTDLQRRMAALGFQAKDAFVQSVRGLVQALEARDPYTRHHSENVTRYAVAIAEQMGLDPEAVSVIRRAARVHDIGKIGVPDDLLRKQGELDERQRRAMRNHVLIGVHILEQLRFLERELPLVRHHHERWDGKGYPDGISGHAIPRGARILAVADAFDALTSERPYSRAVDVAEALRVIIEEAGTQFDPEVVDALIACIRRTARETGKAADLTPQDVLSRGGEPALGAAV